MIVILTRILLGTGTLLLCIGDERESIKSYLHGFFKHYNATIEKINGSVNQNSQHENEAMVTTADSQTYALEIKNSTFSLFHCYETR